MQRIRIMCPFHKKGSSQNAGSGCLFFSNIFLFQALSLFPCTVIFECSASFLHLWRKLVKEIRNIPKLRKLRRDILLWFSKLREFPTEIGEFVGNIRLLLETLKTRLAPHFKTTF